ncbi:YT521-B-like domain-containing protein [Pisolithus marmoratus]|nr:YT521-B-like domain-containing protein [Pisolithus marmoratus]
MSTHPFVRRHHTISAASRTARAGARSTISEETQEQQLWNDDEPVDEDWVGGVGAVGEKTSLHRQSSLPTKSRRALHARSSRQPGNLTPRGVNSLTAIAGHDGDEEDWENDMPSFHNEEEDLSNTSAAQHQQVVEAQTQSYTAGPIPSPPAGSGVRRHQSLTYGAQSGVKQMSGLKRAGTLQSGARQPTAVGHNHMGLQAQGQYPTSPMGRSSPWNTPGSGDWRTPGASFSSTGTNNIDEVTRALSTMELNSTMYNSMTIQNSQSAQPPRFNPSAAPSSGMRGNYMQGGNGNARKLQLNSDLDGRKTPTAQPAIGPRGSGMEGDRAKDKLLSQRTSNPSLSYGYNLGQKGNIPSVPPIPAQYLNQVGNAQAPRLGTNFPQGSTQQNQADNAQTRGGFLNSPVDIPTLVATKGYNPVTFETRPSFARYFVIKSYTEDDVHKSLKYEIWSSTDPGNKRLDKAFKECAGRGPIYLFFSVNASGHFCGMAEMLTPVDYTRSSTVWASDKWKGVFKVRWIFVRDIPNAGLRHIRLNNTAERKPVTNSRDTQELLPEAGQEMLRIFHSHPARTSLLQDFAFYELQSLQKMQAQTTASSGSDTSTPQSQSPPPQQQTMFTMANMATPNAMYGAMSPGIGGAMSPAMLQMQMQMGMINPFGMPQTQAMHQSVMRHPSPAPTNNQNYMNMGGVPF